MEGSWSGDVERRKRRRRNYEDDADDTELGLTWLSPSRTINVPSLVARQEPTKAPIQYDEEGGTIGGDADRQPGSDLEEEQLENQITSIPPQPSTTSSTRTKTKTYLLEYDFEGGIIDDDPSKAPGATLDENQLNARPTTTMRRMRTTGEGLMPIPTDLDIGSSDSDIDGGAQSTNSPSATTSSSSDKSPNTSVIIGASVAATAAVFALIGFAIFFYLRRKKRRRQAPPASETGNEIHSMSPLFKKEKPYFAEIDSSAGTSVASPQLMPPLLGQSTMASQGYHEMDSRHWPPAAEMQAETRNSTPYEVEDTQVRYELPMNERREVKSFGYNRF